MKRERFYSTAIVILSLVILIVVYMKFFHNAPDRPVDIKNIRAIKVYDGSGTLIGLSDILEEEKNYCLLFDLNDCYSCIAKGISDLKSLKKSGKPCFGLVVHNLSDEVSGWSTQQGFSPFFMLKKTSFYEHIRSPATPVMITIKDEKVIAFRYITP